MSVPVNITDPNLAILFFEAALHATPEGKVTLGLLLNNPALFPFQIPIVTSDSISKCSDRMDVDQYGFGDNLVKLRIL